jgi:hypothetical protein
VWSVYPNTIPELPLNKHPHLMCYLSATNAHSADCSQAVLWHINVILTHLSQSVMVVSQATIIIHTILKHMLLQTTGSRP